MYKRYKSVSICPEEGGVFQGCNLTGIENFLTPSLIKKSVARKRQRLNAVLDEQVRQYASGCFDPHRLALVSQCYSKSSIQRSLKIGMIQQLR